MLTTQSRKIFGLGLIVIGAALLALPEAIPMRMLSVGLGVSHRDPNITVLADSVSSFEVARVYNTGSEPYTVETLWRATGGTLQGKVYVNLHPAVTTLQPGGSILLVAQVATPREAGTLIGVVELTVSETEEVPPETTMGGVVLPGAELPFTINVVQPDEWKKPLFDLSSISTQDLMGLLSISAGVFVIARSRRRRR